MSGANGPKVIIIKKKAKHGGHHGGAWKVAYADFVTAMMALFIVLWLLTQSDQASREKIAQYFRTGMLPGGTLTLGTPAGSNPPVPINIFPSGSVGGPQEQPPPELKQLAKDVEIMLESIRNDPEMKETTDHISIKTVNEGTLIELVDGGDNFMFPPGSTSLKPKAVEFLQRLAPILARLRNKLEIHGHTDAHPYGVGKKTNWDLSFERANEARRVLETAGVPSNKIHGVLAHADSSPFNKKDPFAPENRRLALLVLRVPRGKKDAAPQNPGSAGPNPGTTAPSEPATPQNHEPKEH